MKRVAEYRRLYELLRRQIVEGIYSPGDLIPSENELKAVHRLSQPTVRRAVELLEEEGFVRRHQGKGSIVRSRPVGVGIISFDGDLFTSQYNNPKVYTSIIRSPELVRDLPAEFGFPVARSEAGSGFYFLERQRRVGRRVIFHEALCLPNINIPRFRQIKLENASFYEALLRHYTIITTAYEQRFWAVRADDAIAGVLNINPGDPVQRLQRKFSTNRPDFYIYSNLSASTEGIYLFSQSR